MNRRALLASIIAAPLCRSLLAAKDEPAERVGYVPDYSDIDDQYLGYTYSRTCGFKLYDTPCMVDDHTIETCHVKFDEPRRLYGASEVR